jgi:GAF domain-containing protein
MAAAGNESNTLPNSPRLDLEENQLVVPITIRGEVIGSVILRRESGSVVWTEDDLLLVQDVLEQIEPALESARLLEETQARAMREQAVNVISTQMRRSAGMDAILQNTVRELGKVLGSTRTFIQLDIETSDKLPG